VIRLIRRYRAGGLSLR
jgi:hypothetical protein